MGRLRKNKQSSDAPRRRRDESMPTASESNTTPTSFRRNRTLVGSRSPQISSGNELNAELVSPRAAVHHLTRRRRRIMRRLGLLIGLSVIVYLFLGQLVADVIVSANNGLRLSTSLEQSYRESAQSYYGAHPTERFYPSLNQRALNEFFTTRHPELAEASLSLTGGIGDGTLQVQLREPIAKWIIDGRTQFVDSSGAVFAINMYSEPSLTIVDENATVTKEKLVTSNRFLSFVGKTVGDLKTRGLTVTKATIPLLTTRQLNLTIKGVSYEFRLSVDRSIGEQAEDVARIVKYLRKEGIQPDYVDIRVKGKAFYR